MKKQLNQGGTAYFTPLTVWSGAFYHEKNYETKELVMKYDFAAIEKKWQEKWEQEKPYAAVTGDKKPKFDGLI